MEEDGPILLALENKILDRLYNVLMVVNQGLTKFALYCLSNITATKKGEVLQSFVCHSVFSKVVNLSSHEN